MRDLVVFAIVMLSLPLAFRRPFLGLLVFSWLAYMRPQDLCWGFARSMRFSFFAAIAMILGWFAHEIGRRRFVIWDLRTALMALLLAATSVSLVFAEKIDEYVIRYYIEFLKIILIALFTTGQVDSKERLRLLLWTICLSLGFYGIKGGIFGILSGGSPILRGPGGMLEDNNDFALGLVMNIPLLVYLGRAEKKPWVRLGCDVGVGLTLITILLTHSRGGFLAAVATLLLIAWRSGKLIRAMASLLVLALLFFTFAPTHVVERIASIGKGGEERSANARLISWTIALRMIDANPVLGVGLRNFQNHWVRHSEGVAAEGGFAYVAHNSYLQIWAEGGTPAFAAYILLLGSVFFACRRVRAYARARDDLEWARLYANLFETVLIGFLVGAVFLNRGHFDLIYHDLAMVTALLVLVRTARRADPARAAGAPRGLTFTWQPAVAGPVPLPRWGRLA